MENPNTHKNANARALKKVNGTLTHNRKTSTPKTANLNVPHLKSDARTILYANQDEVAQLIGRREFKGKWIHVVKGSIWYQWTGTYWHQDIKAGGFDTTRKGIRTAIDRMWNWVKWMLLNAGLSDGDQKKLVNDADKAKLLKLAKHYISAGVGSRNPAVPP